MHSIDTTLDVIFIVMDKLWYTLFKMNVKN